MPLRKYLCSEESSSEKDVTDDSEKQIEMAN